MGSHRSLSTKAKLAVVGCFFTRFLVGYLLASSPFVFQCAQISPCGYRVNSGVWMVVIKDRINLCMQGLSLLCSVCHESLAVRMGFRSYGTVRPMVVCVTINRRIFITFSSLTERSVLVPVRVPVSKRF